MSHGRALAVTALVLATVGSLVAGPGLVLGATDSGGSGPDRPGVTVAQQTSDSSAVTVTNVSLSPEEPVVGDTFQVDVTVTNHEGAGSTFDISEVYVDKPDGRSYVANQPGTLPPGTSTQVSIPVTVDSPGQYTLSVRVNGVETDGGSVVSTNYPVPVRVVTEQQPRLNLVGSDWEADSESAATVTIANGAVDPIRNLELELDGEEVQVDSPTRVRASLGGESNVTYEFGVTPQSVGTRQLTARLRYTDPAGNDKQVVTDHSITVEERDPGLSLALSAAEVGPSERTDFDVTIVNEQQDDITGLELRFETDDGQMVDSQRVVPTLQSGNQTSVTLEARDIQPGRHELTVRASYTTSSESRSRSRRRCRRPFRPSRNRGTSRSPNSNSVAAAGRLASVGA